MFHPFQGDIASLSDSEVEEKIKELSKKYFVAQRQNNNHLLTQLHDFIILYRDELTARSLKRKNTENRDDDLDNLINVE